MEQSNCQTRNLSCTLWYGFISSSDPPNSFPLSHSTPPRPDHLATFLHVTLRISLLIDSAHGFLCLLRSHIFCLGPFVYQPSRTQVWTFPHGILLITHAHHQPVVPAEHKGTRNMPPGEVKHTLKIIEAKHWISECHTLESLELGFRQVLPLSEVIAEAGAVFEQGLSKQSKVVLRSGRVQHGSTTFCSLIIAAVVVTECHWSTMH